MNDWLSEIELYNQYRRDDAIVPLTSETQDERMARVIRELLTFIRLNIDFDSPLRPVGIRKLSDDAKELIPGIKES